MFKAFSFSFLAVLFVNSAIVCAVEADVTSPLEQAKKEAKRAVQENTGKADAFKKKYPDLSAKISSHVNAIAASDAFKSALEKMTTQQADDIANGKSFTDIFYNHSLEKEFPKFKADNQTVYKALSNLYSWITNAAHYQLLLNKLEKGPEAQAAPVSEEDTSKSQEKSEQEASAASAE